MMKQLPSNKGTIFVHTEPIKIGGIVGLILAGIWGLQQFTSSTETVSGYAFLDYNGDGIENGYDKKFPVLTVNVYSDADGDGTLSDGDKILASGLTDENGQYSIDIDYSSTSISQRIADSNDDVEERVSDGDMYRTSSDLEMVYDGSKHQKIGIRFESVNLPPAAKITSAVIEFKAKNSSSATPSLSIYGEKAVQSKAFSSTDYDLSSRTKTSKVVTWNTTSWSSGSSYDTDDLSEIVSEITSQAGWLPGDPMTFIIEGSSDTKNAYSGTSSGPQLKISYTMPTNNYIVAIDTNCLVSGSTISNVEMSKGSATNILVSYRGEAVACYSVADESPDTFVMINRVSGRSRAPGGGGVTGTSSIETVAFDFLGSNLFTVNANTVGKLDVTSGKFTATSGSVGKGDGADGSISFSDIDGLAFHPLTGDLWATHRRSGDYDLLLKIDTASGTFVSDVFGSGIDYVEIAGKNVLNDIDDIAISSSDGKMYAVNNGSGDYEFLLEIVPETGVATIIDTLNWNGKYLKDMEGFGFTNFGLLLGTTGNSGDEQTENSLYEIDLSTAEANWIGTFSLEEDYEGCDCLIAAPNTLSGVVFDDTENDLTYDGGEAVFENATIYIYLDNNNDGDVDETDTLIDSLTTDAKGAFSWTTASNKDFVSVLDLSSISNAYQATTATESSSAFSSGFGGLIDENNDFGLIDDVFLPVEFGALTANWQGQDARIEWTTLSEQNNDFFAVERSLEGSLFEVVGKVEATGNSQHTESYSFLDSRIPDLSQPSYFYRLKQVDVDGSWSYSQVVQLSLADFVDEAKLNVYPNPARDWLNIDYQISLEQATTGSFIRIYDLKGTLVQSKNVTDSSNRLRLDVSSWQKGLYILTLESGIVQAQKKLVIR